MKTLSDEGQRIMERSAAGIKPTYEERKRLLKEAIDMMKRAGDLLEDIGKRCEKRMRDKAFDNARIF